MKKIYWALVIGLLVWNVIVTVSLMNIASSVTKTTDENVETAVISHTVHGYTTDLTEAVSEVQSKVVTVNAFTEDKNISMSGIIYSSSSNGTYIVTSSSNLNEEEAITVRFDNNISLMATIVGTDTETDCAVLLVNPDFDAEAVTLGDSDILKTGEYIFSLSGREEGTDAGIASFGVVSSTAQTQTKSGAHISEVLVSDITLSDISNGAPIFNINGDMVGMLTTELSSSNNKLATAISVNELKLVVDEIISTDTVERGYLGIIGRNISDIQSYEKSFYSLQLDITSGVLVTRVLENSPAINAGIQTNDVIVGIGETEIKDLKSLRECLYKLNTGDTVTVTINRQGNLVTLTVVLE